jgi:hypothetical protein
VSDHKFLFGAILVALCWGLPTLCASLWLYGATWKPTPKQPKE